MLARANRVLGWLHQEHCSRKALEEGHEMPDEARDMKVVLKLSVAGAQELAKQIHDLC